MRISPLSPLLQQQMLAALPEAAAGFRAALPQQEAPVAAGVSHPQPAMVPATSVQMLVQLAAADPAIDRRRKMAEKADRGLALLDRLQAETVARPTSIEPLTALREWLDTFDMPEDSELAALMDEIKLRVRVELAKHDMWV
ncbi:flagellar assembly protein FliX [Sphingomonas sp. OV641]|uniref:flagellar assembly protein FliX n=1 Tax=Sphingomonas sp. OV641 TaxID=1881068 RepID=UPI000B867B52|nr:flagellar assembly protein FliX [Sphingomonas sp. OV641]